MQQIKNLIYFVWSWNRTRLYKKKLKRILKVSGKSEPDATLISKYKKLWSVIEKRPTTDYPALYANVNGKQSYLYTPEHTYYNTVELILNHKSFTPAFADKNFYEIILKDHRSLFPLTYLRGINGTLYGNDYQPLKSNATVADIFENNTICIIKPSIETSGGANLKIAEMIDGKVIIGDKHYSFEGFSVFLKTFYRNNVIVQEYIRQNAWYSGFNASSVNTVRIFTYRSVKDNTVHILHSIIRFGRSGSIVDNQAAGGLSIGISNNDRLNSFAIDKFGNKFHDLDHVNKNAGNEVPGIAKMKETAKTLAANYPYHRLLGFDFCLDAHGNVRLLEINCKNIETNFLQMNNGPLFGEFTTEIVEYCVDKRRAVVFDFYV